MQAEMAADQWIPHSALPIPHLNGSFLGFISGLKRGLPTTDWVVSFAQVLKK